MLALPKYLALSAGAVTCVVAHALYTREQYFPAMMYLSTSKAALVAIGNFAFALMLVLAHAVKATFLGTLREAEVERLYERTRDAVMETCLAMTIFREEFNSRFVALFVSLLFVKAFHWLYQDRVQYTETAPTLSRFTHVRLATFMGTLLLVDLSMLSYIVGNTIENGPSVLLLFGFEYVILATKLFVGFAKYLIISADRMLDGQWQGKGTCVFYLELVTDLLQLFVYFVFFLIIFAYYGMPVHLVRDLYVTFRNFRKRVEEFIRYRRVTANLNDRFPDPPPRTYPRGTTCASFAERIWKWTRKAGANRRSCRADTPFICIAFGLGWNASKRARRADSLSYPNANDAPTLRGKRRKKRSGSLYRQSCKPDTYRQRWLRSWTAR